VIVARGLVATKASVPPDGKPQNTEGGGLRAAEAQLVDHVPCHSMSKGEDACFVTRSAP
jgi:hypothetical protein